MIRARIEQHKGDALWLMIDRLDEPGDVEQIKNVLDIRPEDNGNVAYAVTVNELVPIRDAINEYLKTHA